MPFTVLVVDDEAHILQVLSLKLRNADYTVLTATDGEEGLDIARRERPHLIITDYQMPYMTGLEMCKDLANDEATAAIPVVMLTARGFALEDDDLAACNIQEMLGKPFSPRALLELVDGFLKASKSDDTSRETRDVA